MDNSKPDSIVKMFFKPETWQEKYVIEISVPEELRSMPPGKGSNYTIKFPDPVNFQSGTLAKTDILLKGSLNRGTGELNIELEIPNRIEENAPNPESLEVEILGKNRKIDELKKEFTTPYIKKKKNNDMDFFNYMTKIKSSKWNDNIDDIVKIRIVFNIRFDKYDDTFLLESLNTKDELSEIEQFMAFKEQKALLFNSKDLSDAIIRCGTDEILVHKWILDLASPAFKEMFGTEMKEKKEEVIINEFKINILKLMIEWIYTGKIGSADFQDQVTLFKAAHKYEIVQLKNFCALQISAGISADNALEMYDFGNLYKNDNILEQARKLIRSNKRKLDETHCKEIINKYPKLAIDLIKG